MLIVIQSCSVMSDSLWPHGLQHSRLPCSSPFPGVCSNSCPLSQWHHPTISSSVIPFSSCLQSFPSSRSFPRSRFFTSSGQSIRVSPSPFQWIFRVISFRTDWFDLLAVQGTLLSSPTPQFEGINLSALSLFYCPALTYVHDYWKNHSFDYTNLCRQSDVSAF